MKTKTASEGITVQVTSASNIESVQYEQESNSGEPQAEFTYKNNVACSLETPTFKSLQLVVGGTTQQKTQVTWVLP